MKRTRIAPLAWIALSCVAVALVGCGGSVSAPTSFDDYNAKDGSFACTYPSGWEVKGGGRGGMYSASFTQGSAKIKVNTDFAGSILGDIAEGGMSGFTDMPGVDMSEEELEDLSAVAEVHRMGKDSMAEEFGDYKEQPAEKIDTGVGEGRLSEFTGKTTFGGKMHGYRLTILSNDRRVIVVCRAPEKSWETLKPAFKKTIDSLKYGTPEI